MPQISHFLTLVHFGASPLGERERACDCRRWCTSQSEETARAKMRNDGISSACVITAVRAVRILLFAFTIFRQEVGSFNLFIDFRGKPFYIVRFISISFPFPSYFNVCISILTINFPSAFTPYLEFFAVKPSVIISNATPLPPASPQLAFHAPILRIPDSPNRLYHHTVFRQHTKCTLPYPK
jgi:hypothetical protein